MGKVSFFPTTTSNVHHLILVEKNSKFTAQRLVNWRCVQPSSIRDLIGGEKSWLDSATAVNDATSGKVYRRSMEEELTVDALGLEHPDLVYLKSAVAIRKEGLLLVRAGAVQLPEGAGAAGAARGGVLE
jgi:hypothetical protein